MCSNNRIEYFAIPKESVFRGEIQPLNSHSKFPQFVFHFLDNIRLSRHFRQCKHAHGDVMSDVANPPTFFKVIKSVIEQIMTTRRIIQLSYKPLQPQEIYEFFLSKGLEPVQDKVYKKFQKWYNKTPLGKERGAFNKWADLKREQEARANEKKKK